MLSTETQALIWSNAYQNNYINLMGEKQIRHKMKEVLEDCEMVADITLEATLDKFKDKETYTVVPSLLDDDLPF